MPTIDYASARNLLEKFFPIAEKKLLESKPPSLDPEIEKVCETIFQSNTQAYREVLLGCTIAKIQDSTIDIRLPYIDLGLNAFSGRTLDEKVINPFLQSKRIPCSKGPYLSVFRRSVRFHAEIRSGLRDKISYDAFLNALFYLENKDPQAFLEYQLYKFCELREAANIPLSRLHRISLEQFDKLFTGLLSTQSGGLFPVIFAVAMFNTIKTFFKLDWEVTWQGINVADSASGAGGDITILSEGKTVLAIEVTERTVDKSRVVSIFNTKIAPTMIEDYLFFVGNSKTTEEAKLQAQQYFAQGHEVNFVNLKEWMLMSLVTIGKGGRDIFNKELMNLLETSNIHKALKVIWNEQINSLTGI